LNLLLKKTAVQRAACKRAWILLLGSSLLAGCSGFALVSRMLVQPTREVSSSELFFDDFSENNSGWDRFESEAGSTDYVRGSYRIAVYEPMTDFYANPYQSYKDTIIEVKAVRVGGPDNNSFGVICRYQDEENFYAAQISSDGFGGIFRMKEGAYTLLGLDQMIPVPAVLGGSGENYIRLECIGNTMTLFANGQPVDYREDDSFTNGDVGLIAGTFDEGGVVIDFDDFRVIKP